MQKGLTQNSSNNNEQIINEIINKITAKIFEEKNFNNYDKLSELKNEIKSFLWLRAVDRSNEVLDQNQIDLIARNGNDFDKFFNNNLISDEIKMDIFFKISKLRFDILQNELVHYVKEKYDVSDETIVYIESVIIYGAVHESK